MEFEIQKAPDWKTAFLSKPSVSTRKGIAFGYEAPSEETSTLVLTAPSGKFVDIRFPKEMASTSSGQTPQLSANPSFWAFSGVSQTTFYERYHDSSPGLPYTAHTVFKHDIDSKGPGIVDEGDCFLLPNGDAVEIGIWHDTKQLYKELWTEPDPPRGRDSIVKSPVVVVEHAGHNSGRGIMIRIGGYIQGVFEHKGQPVGLEKVVVVRALRDDNKEPADDTQRKRKIGVMEEEESSDTWTKDPRSSIKDDDILPWRMLCGNALTSNQEFEVGGNVWRVVERLMNS